MKRFVHLFAVVVLLLATSIRAADLSITATSVAPSSGSVTIDVVSGATITAGKACYLSSTDGKAYLADTNSATAEARVLRGIALNAASAGQPVRLQTAGQITIGATVTVGTVYVLSATAGGIAPVTDLATGHYTTIVGVGLTSSVIGMSIYNGGVAVP